MADDEYELSSRFADSSLELVGEKFRVSQALQNAGLGAPSLAFNHELRITALEYSFGNSNLRETVESHVSSDITVTADAAWHDMTGTELSLQVNGGESLIVFVSGFIENPNGPAIVALWIDQFEHQSVLLPASSGNGGPFAFVWRDPPRFGSTEQRPLKLRWKADVGTARCRPQSVPDQYAKIIVMRVAA